MTANRLALQSKSSEEFALDGHLPLQEKLLLESNLLQRDLKSFQSLTVAVRRLLDFITDRCGQFGRSPIEVGPFGRKCI